MKIPHTINNDGTITLGGSHAHNVVMLNPTEKAFYAGRYRGRESGGYVLQFGAYGWTRLHVYAEHLQDALDACVDWIEEHAPGLLCDDQVAEAYAEAISEGMSEEEARDHAEVDTTQAGNHGRYLNSSEWAIALEKPSGKALRAYVAGIL